MQLLVSTGFKYYFQNTFATFKIDVVLKLLREQHFQYKQKCFMVLFDVTK